MRPRHYLELLLMLLLVPAGIDARLVRRGASRPSSIKPSQSAGNWRYNCNVDQILKGGTISLSRLYTGDGEPPGDDFMGWKPAGHDPQRVRRPLDLELSYIWNQATQPTVELRRIELKLLVGIDTDLPAVAWVQIQRPFPVEPHGILGSTALTTQVFPYSEHDMHNGHGELPLGDLLAYADGYDTLDWSLIRSADQLGASDGLTRGTIDVAALREAVGALPGLRSALAVKATKPRASCQRIWWGDQISY